jgi:hypothetical protein
MQDISITSVDRQLNSHEDHDGHKKDAPQNQEG